MQPDTLIIQISNFIIKFAPGIVLFFVGVITLYNLRDMISQWFVGRTLIIGKEVDELDIFKIDGGRWLLIKIGSYRLRFLGLDDEDNFQKKNAKLKSIGNKRFIDGNITKVGKLFN